VVTAIILFPIISIGIISYFTILDPDFASGSGGAAVGIGLIMLDVLLSPAWICLGFYFGKKLD